MIDRILDFSLRQRAFVLLGAVALLGAGLWSATHLPIDAVPDITGVQVQVNTEVPALAAEESEKLVTQPIERELAGLPGVEEMRSITKFGLSQVTLQFKDGTDIYRARQLVAERLQGVMERLPAGASSKLAPISTGLGEIFYYNVQYRADATNKPATELEQLIELSEIQEYTIKPSLRTVAGIAEINESGGYEKQYVMQPKPDALAEVGMTFSELAGLVAQNVQNAGGGIISRGGQQLTIRAVSRVASVEDIANLPLKFGAGVKPLLVKDVAEVKVGTKFRTGAATLNGHETFIGTTMMLAGQNSREVAERVKARIAEIQAKLPVRLGRKENQETNLRDNQHTMKTTLQTILVTAAVLVGLCAANAADKKHLGGPKGGRLLEKTEPRAEFFVVKDRSVTITFYDAMLKPVPATAQTVTVITDAKDGKAKVEFEKKGDVLTSKTKLPEGDGYNLVVQFKQTADAKPQNFRFKLETHTSGGCKRAEYACTCDE